VLSGHKMTVIVCDNGGYAVINRLQVNQGGVPFNNLIADSRIVEEVRVDFAAHAAAMGCRTETVSTIAELEAAWLRAKQADRTTVIAMQTHQNAWTEGGSWWEVGVPEVSSSEAVQAARAELENGKSEQRAGW
jgi:3D-(3,5/4)-trihydroxycyclohexane-1,2-dione acylhydrolase (decyclizing)